MFNVYVLFLILSGVAMLIMAFTRADYAKRRQVVNFIFGAGFLIYGLYLLLVFRGGTYYMFYYVFVLPILAAYQFFRARSAAKAAQTAATVPAYPPVGNFSQAGSSPQAGNYPQPGIPWAAGPGAENVQGGYTQGGGYAQDSGHTQGGGYPGGSNSW